MGDLREIRDVWFTKKQWEQDLDRDGPVQRDIRTLLSEVERLKAENARLTTALKKIEELPRSMVPDSYTAMVDMARIAREALKGG